MDKPLNLITDSELENALHGAQESARVLLRMMNRNSLELCELSAELARRKLAQQRSEQRGTPA